MDNLENIIKYTYGLNLLYVEDDKNARVSTVIIFEEFFEHIVVAVDGKDGIEKFQQNDIDIIITDINMPNLNGLEMIDEIRKFNLNVPILVLSAYNESNLFMDSIKLGVEGYLLKPIDIDQFLIVINKIVNRFQLEDEAAKSLSLLQQYQEITDKNLIVSKTTPEGLITYANNKFCEISEYSREELLGKNHNIVRHPENDNHIYTKLWEQIKEKKEIWQGTLKNISKSGKTYYVQSTIKPILDNRNNIVEFIALKNNITKIMNPLKQLSDFVESSINPMVVRLKIDGFNDIENIYGSKLSLTIEENFAKKLEKLMPQENEYSNIYSLGNGEYAFAKDQSQILIDEHLLINQIKEFQKIVNKEKIKAYEFDYEISILISIGFGYEVVENTKIGMMKLLEKNQDFIVANDLSIKAHKDAQKNMDIIKMVKVAIENSQIISYFQPIIDNKTKKTVKYESLIRLITPEGKVLSPLVFLETSKRGKYYSKITSIVLKNSFETLKYTQCDITINLSVVDIENESTRLNIYNLIEQNHANMHRIVFELLEDEETKDFSLIKNFIQHVKSFGAKIAIDDFGSGYSNFERLLDYQPDILKIDGSLIKNIETDSFSLSIVKTIVAFAKEQNIQTVGEYVKNEAIYNILNTIGVDYSQGYYFGKPSLIDKHTEKI